MTDDSTNLSSLSNSEDLKKLIISTARTLIEIDVKRQEMNREAADIRQTLKDRGVDIEAFRDVYQYFKKRRHEREGYDEYHKLCWDALNAAETGSLFEYAATRGD